MAIELNKIVEIDPGNKEHSPYSRIYRAISSRDMGATTACISF